MAVAAYAAVVSLMHVLDRIQHPAMHRLHVDRKQIQALEDKVSFLREFLELYYSQRISNEIQGLAWQISDVVNEAEDIVDSHVVNQIHDVFPNGSGTFFLFCGNIERVIEKIDSIMGKLMKFKEVMTLEKQQPGVSLPAASAAPPSMASGKNSMVGFDERLVRIMEELTGYGSCLQIVPIVGMGGIGKTTLARNAFENPHIKRHFDICIWFTVSQKYGTHEILLGLLEEPDDRKTEEVGESLAELGSRLHYRLFDRRYLIVLDDIWSTNVWNDIRLFFPDNKNGSQIMVTTRLSHVAVSLGSQNPYIMDLLDEDKSWVLFRKEAFAKDGCCPSELHKVGKIIAKSCKGLPLAIVIIGGLLSRSNMKRQYWSFIAENVISFVNSEDDEHCLRILSLSYDHLPIYLKPCFLYMRVFPESKEIQVSKLIKLWVAEGFIKSIIGKSLEEVAEGYLKDLIDRNLILIRNWTHRGKMRRCVIHDLLRDLCLREFEKEHLLSTPKVQRTSFPRKKVWCFLCNGMRQCTKIFPSQVIVASRATSPAPFLVCYTCRSKYPQLNAIRLVAADAGYGLKNFRAFGFSENILHPTKLRYLTLHASHGFLFPCTLMLLCWNLQTIVISNYNYKEPVVLPGEIWKMPQLRHLMIGYAILPDPVGIQTSRSDSTIILENLQKVSTILNFRCSKEVLGRIPNMMKLRICYSERDSREWSYYFLHNLKYLYKLESLDLYVSPNLYMSRDRLTLKMAVFPYRLQKLILTRCRIRWEEMSIVGRLSYLEVLKLYNAAAGREWDPVEGEFLKLKLLLIRDCDLKCWRAEKDHSPNLESLFLEEMDDLKKIPSGIGDIETLQLIDLRNCNISLVNSAKEILKEQESLGIEGLQLHVVETQLRRSY